MPSTPNSASAPTSPSLSLSAAPPADTDTDLLVIPWFEGDGLQGFEAINQATGREVERALASGEFAARPFDLLVTPLTDVTWKARRVALIGAGSANSFNSLLARRLATAAAAAARQRRVDRLAFVLRSGPPDASGDVDVAGLVQATAEGLTLSEFNGWTYKTGEPAPPAVSALTIVLGGLADNSPDTSTRVNAAAAKGRLLGEVSNLARDLANEPGNMLPPHAFATKAANLAAAGGASVEILDEKQIEELGMGMLLGVARGSVEPPRLVVIRHDPPGAPTRPVLGLVGKGITFDTGGISIKPAEAMDRMKDDMAGGAAVAAAMHAIARLGAPIRVVGIIPAAENMPGGRALKPGDVLRSAEGKTVEVLNTDAEGRLVLGDALWYARKLGVTHLVDVATLTGAMLVALGKVASGIFGTPDAWVNHVRAVADRAGDRVWPMPIFDEYRDQLKSEIADFTNTGGRPAGSITAALFLKEFTGGLPWAHIDIAGTAWIEDAKPYLPKGPSGVAVRTLAELAFTSNLWT